MRERTELEERLNALSRFERDLEDAITLVELGESENDAGTEKEGIASLKALLVEAERRQIETLLSGEADANDSYLEIHSGAGGTESCDWARMLLRMYTRWAERRKYKVADLMPASSPGVSSISSTLKRRRATRPASSRRPC